MAKVQVDEAAVKRIVKMHGDGDDAPVIAAATALSVSVVREVLHAKGRTKASAAIRARAKKNLARWLAADAPSANGNGRKKTAVRKSPAQKRAGVGARR